MVKRKVSLKALGLRQASRKPPRAPSARPSRCSVGITDDKAREVGKFIKGLGLKGVQHQIQGDQLRVNGKKRDDLQIA